MADIQEEVRAKMRRTINQEFSRMEDDFDHARGIRMEISDKLMNVVRGVNLVNDKDLQVTESTDTGLRVINAALKTLTDLENANAKAIGLRLKQSEQEIASSAATKDRIAIVLKATQPGRISAVISQEDMEAKLDDMFDGQIQDFELKSNPRDLSDS